MSKLLQILVFVCAIFIISDCFAQSGSTTEFEINGLKVIYKNVPKDIVSVRLFVEGGTANYPKQQEGIENFAFRLAVEGGTESLSKNEFNESLESIGAQIGATSDYDYGQFSLKCLKPYWEQSWSLYTDAILNPAFTQEQFDLLKEQLITAAKQAASDADSRLVRAAMENAFSGQDYAKDPNGTVESLEQMSLSDIKSYYGDIIGTSRAFLVVVGDLELDDLKTKIEKSFGSLPEGSAVAQKERNMFSEPSNMIEDREISTNYIRGYMSAPQMNTRDGIPMMIAMSILHNRLWVEIRTKRGLSYAPQAYMPGGIITNPYNVLYVSTTDPAQAIDVMVSEINKLKKEGFSVDELENKKQSFLTSHLMGQETLSSQSNALALMEMKGGWEMNDEFTQRVNEVTIEDINRVIDTYTDVISWTYLGKKDMINEEDLLQPGKFPDNVDLEKR